MVHWITVCLCDVQCWCSSVRESPSSRDLSGSHWSTAVHTFIAFVCGCETPMRKLLSQVHEAHRAFTHRQQKDYIASLSVMMVSSHILHISLFSAHNITWRAVMLCIRNVGDLCSQYSKYAFQFTCFVFCIDEGIITRVRWLCQSCLHRNVVSCKDDACIGMWCGFTKRCIWSKTCHLNTRKLYMHTVKTWQISLLL